MNNERVVIVGNPVDGIRVFGPFKNDIDAMRWAEDTAELFENGEWWITSLEDPDND